MRASLILVSLAVAACGNSTNIIDASTSLQRGDKCVTAAGTSLGTCATGLTCCASTIYGSDGGARTAGSLTCETTCP